MTMDRGRRSRWWILALLLIAGLIAFGADAGKMLVVDAPQPADVIVVLAGETDYRPARALELLDQGYARRLLIDIPAEATIFGRTIEQLAEQYEHSRPEAAQLGICRIEGLSTRDESHDVEKCLAKEQGSRILIVTSDFHTHRALSIFRREIPGKTFSVAAAYDGTQFGTHWWAHRQWAKTWLDEWLRWFWWTLVERWR
jgi:uncharacterized SAM-binding protein YcdF (DUF218 family)